MIFVDSPLRCKRFQTTASSVPNYILVSAVRGMGVVYGAGLFVAAVHGMGCLVYGRVWKCDAVHGMRGLVYGIVQKVVMSYMEFSVWCTGI